MKAVKKSENDLVILPVGVESKMDGSGVEDSVRPSDIEIFPIHNSEVVKF